MEPSQPSRDPLLGPPTQPDPSSQGFAMHFPLPVFCFYLDGQDTQTGHMQVSVPFVCPVCLSCLCVLFVCPFCVSLLCKP